MIPQPIPEELRRRLSAQWSPVRPLPAAWKRVIPVALIILAMACGAMSLFSLRSDLGAIPSWLSWGCSLLELAFGVVLVGLALRESIPGERQPTGLVIALVAGGVLIQALTGAATWLRNPTHDTPGAFVTHGISCLAHDSMLALPTLAIAMWLILRALPTRAPVAGVVGGAGAGLSADAIMHLQCPVSDLGHVLVWHTGALLLMMAMGWAAGTLWDRARH